MNPTVATPPLESALFEGQIKGRPVRYLFPVVPGMPAEIVAAEVRRRLNEAGQGAALDDLDAKLSYPAGPFNAELQPGNPPIGAGQGAPPVDRSLGHTVIPQGNGPPPSSAAPSGLPTDAFPSDRPPPRSPGVAVAELEQVLAVWKQRHGVTSSEFYYYLTGLLNKHASGLVARERGNRG